MLSRKSAHEIFRRSIMRRIRIWQHVWVSAPLCCCALSDIYSNKAISGYSIVIMGFVKNPPSFRLR
jgi:hypothetical protein